MLPAEEYMYLKRKFEAEKAARLQAAKIRQQKAYDYNAAAFAQAMHGMNTTMFRPPLQTDLDFRMKAGKPIEPQPKYINTKKVAHINIAPTRPRPMFKEPPKTQKVKYAKKPLPKEEYSNPQFRNNHVYKPAGLTGKAGEVLGVTNKKMYAAGPGPVYNKAAKKAAKQAVKYAPKPVKGRMAAKRSTGCVVM
jgi:hypothetical protein